MRFKLAYKSLMNRKSAVVLTVVSMTIGIMLLISIHFIKDQVRTSFSKTISGIDLIVGAKTSDVNMLLYSVFHVGSPTDSLSWAGFQSVRNNDKTKWAIPISLGDSHYGYRVIGTDDSYVNHYQFGNQQALAFDTGQWFDHPFDVVLGHEVAAKLKYSVGDMIHLSHGVSKTSFQKHDQINFKITGILSQTGTPVDQSLFVSLIGLEAVHLNWPRNSNDKQRLIEHIVENGLQTQVITATFVALKNKSTAFIFQRQINQNKSEPIQAILPGVALAQIWNITQVFEQVLLLVGGLVFIATVIGMVNMLIMSLYARKKELALLRIIGASPLYCFLLVQFESLLLVIISIILAVFSLFFVFLMLDDWLASNYGFFVDLNTYLNADLLVLSTVVLLISIPFVCIPAIMFYRQSMTSNNL